MPPSGLAEIPPHSRLTRNQVDLMQIDTTASGSRPGFSLLGISRSLEEELIAMLKHTNEETQSPKQARTG
jgi:hypothetical protein